MKRFSSPVPIFLTLIIFAASLYLFNLVSYPASVHCDEVKPGIFGQKILNGQIKEVFNVTWLDIPNLSFTPFAAAIFFLGNSIFAFRLPSVIISILSLIFFFLLVRLVFNQRTAFIATFLLSTSHWWIALSRTGFLNFHTVLPEMAAFYFIFLGFKKKKGLYFVLASLLIALGLNLYVNFRLVPLILLSIFLHQIVFKSNLIKSRFEVLKFLIVLLVSTAIFFSPMINFYLKNPKKYLSNIYTSFLFSPSKEAKRHIKSIYQGSEDPKVWLFGNVKKAFNLSTNSGDVSSLYGYRGRILEEITLGLFLIGQVISLTLIKKVKYFFLLAWFWSTYIGLGILTTHVPFLPRLTGAIPVVYIFSSITVDKLLTLILVKLNHKKFSRNVLYVLTMIILLIIAWKNLKIYFIDNFKNKIGYFAKSSRTTLPQYIQSQDNRYKVVFVPDDYIYLTDMCLFTYFYPEGKVLLLKEAELARKRHVPIIFVIHQDYKDKIGEIVVKYPGGRFVFNQFPDVYVYQL